MEGRESMSQDLLTPAASGNCALLEELLKAGMDPDIGDSEGRTALVKFSSLVRNFSTFILYF